MKVFQKSVYYSLSFCLLLSVLSLRGAAQAQQPATLVIEGGTLIDGNGGAPVADALILIQGNKISTVSRKGQVSYPATARVLKADGKFILPGMLDSHCHYEWYVAELLLNHGITGCSNISDGEEVNLAQREAINRGKIVGPRLYLSVGNIGALMTGERYFVPGVGGPLQFRHLVKSPAEALEISKRFIDAGADMIELGDGGLTPEMARAVVEQAHKAGLPVVSRMIGPRSAAREAIEAGVDFMEHCGAIGVSANKDPSRFADSPEGGNRLATYIDIDETKLVELLQLMVQRNIQLECDYLNSGKGYQKDWARFVQENKELLAHPQLTYFPASVRQRWLTFDDGVKSRSPSQVEMEKRGYASLMRILGRFAAMGGKILPGIDIPFGAVAGIGMHHNFETLVDEAGVPPMKVIQGATKWAHEALRVLNKVGTIEAGKLADLVIVNADPLQNIRNLRNIDNVIFDGRVVDRTYHANFGEQQPWHGNYGMGEAAIDDSGWVLRLKEQLLYEGRGEPGRYFPAGIEQMTPLVVTEGSPDVTVTIRGFNFFRKSQVLVYAGNAPYGLPPRDGSVSVPFQRVSGEELRATIPAKFLQKAGTLVITVVNPQPLAWPMWGDSSNKAFLLVNYKY